VKSPLSHRRDEEVLTAAATDVDVAQKRYWPCEEKHSMERFEEIESCLNQEISEDRSTT
jgi:hypothetical protein